jgi:hypothetical protein
VGEERGKDPLLPAQDEVDERRHPHRITGLGGHSSFLVHHRL